jgi:hypothetical protein
MKVTMYGSRRVEIGDKISCQGYTFEVAKIISQDDWGGEDGIYIEFEDTNGRYHYWKEGIDGGKVVGKA